MNDPVFEAFHENGGSRVRLAGELDLDAMPAFRKALQQLHANGAVTLDLSDLTYIDSSGLHMIFQLASEMRGRALLRLESPNQHVLRVLEIVKLAEHDNLVIEHAA